LIPALALALLLPGAAGAAAITAAAYEAPTTRYAHGVFGDQVEYGALSLTMSDGSARRITLPANRVFEDTAPRLADLDGDGGPEVITVETDLERGARLAVYDEAGLVAATPFIGRTHRWLAPVGAGDLDGDGAVEIAYVETPHLGRTLRVWRFDGTGLTHVADLGGLSNHRFGWPDIPGGIRDCGAGPEIVTADGRFMHVMATRLDGGQLSARPLGAYEGKASLAAALDCAAR